MVAAYSGVGTLVKSGPFDGTPTSDAVQNVTSWLEEQNFGRAATNFRLRDWLVSRQRYWGTPIPIVFCESCGEVPVPEDQLPLELPEDVDFTPQDAASPLASATDWVNVPLPPMRRPGQARDRHDGHFRRLLLVLPPVPRPAQHRGSIRSREEQCVDADRPVLGGVEHAVLHLIYARFIQKFLMDTGMADDPEPFPACNQGLITMGGKRMSKSRGTSSS